MNKFWWLALHNYVRGVFSRERKEYHQRAAAWLELGRIQKRIEEAGEQFRSAADLSTRDELGAEIHGLYAAMYEQHKILGSGK